VWFEHQSISLVVSLSNHEPTGSSFDKLRMSVEKTEDELDEELRFHLDQGPADVSAPEA